MRENLLSIRDNTSWSCSCSLVASVHLHKVFDSIALRHLVITLSTDWASKRRSRPVLLQAAHTALIENISRLFEAARALSLSFRRLFAAQIFEHHATNVWIKIILLEWPKIFTDLWANALRSATRSFQARNCLDDTPAFQSRRTWYLRCNVYIWRSTCLLRTFHVRARTFILSFCKDFTVWQYSLFRRPENPCHEIQADTSHPPCQRSISFLDCSRSQAPRRQRKRKWRGKSPRILPFLSDVRNEFTECRIKRPTRTWVGST